MTGPRPREDWLTDCVKAAALWAGDCTHTIGSPETCTVCFARRELRRVGFWKVALPIMDADSDQPEPPRKPWQATTREGIPISGDAPMPRTPLIRGPRTG